MSIDVFLRQYGNYQFDVLSKDACDAFEILTCPNPKKKNTLTEKSPKLTPTPLSPAIPAKQKITFLHKSNHSAPENTTTSISTNGFANKLKYVFCKVDTQFDQKIINSLLADFPHVQKSVVSQIKSQSLPMSLNKNVLLAEQKYKIMSGAGSNGQKTETYQLHRLSVSEMLKFAKKDLVKKGELYNWTTIDSYIAKYGNWFFNEFIKIVASFPRQLVPTNSKPFSNTTSGNIVAAAVGGSPSSNNVSTGSLQISTANSFDDLNPDLSKFELWEWPMLMPAQQELLLYNFFILNQLAATDSRKGIVIDYLFHVKRFGFSVKLA